MGSNLFSHTWFYAFKHDWFLWSCKQHGPMTAALISLISIEGPACRTFDQKLPQWECQIWGRFVWVTRLAWSNCIAMARRLKINECRSVTWIDLQWWQALNSCSWFKCLKPSFQLLLLLFHRSVTVELFCRAWPGMKVSPNRNECGHSLNLWSLVSLPSSLFKYHSLYPSFFS